VSSVSTISTKEPAARRPLLRTAAPVIAAIVGVTSLVSILFAAGRPLMDYSDFAQDYVAAKAWSNGADPYANTPDLIRRYERNTIQALPDRHRDPHTPFQILLARPFNAVPFRAAWSIWVLINAAALIVALFLLMRALSLDRWTAIAVAFGALVLPTVRLALANVEPNPLALLLLVSAWLALKRDRQTGAGIALGIATALRVFPILLIVPLIRKRQYRALKWQLSTTVVLSGVTGLILGTHATIRFITSAAPGNFRYWRAAGHNLSLIGIPFRWLTQSHWFPHSADLPALAGILAVVAFMACVVAASTTPARASGDVFWAAVPWAILASPLAWADYLILLLPLLALQFARATNRMRMLLVLPAVAVMMGRPFFVHAVNPVSTSRQALVLALPLYGVLVLALAEWLHSARSEPEAMDSPANRSRAG
jgi:glycosyl transferase family 87